MKKQKWYFCWTRTGQNPLVQTRMQAKSVKEVRQWAKDNNVEIDGRIKISKF